METSSFVLILTTCDQREPLEAMARQLVEQRLAACVQIGGPVTSIYRWQGKIEQTSEWQLSAKTLDSQRAAVAELIQGLHPYEVPALIALPFSAESQACADWLRSPNVG